MAQTMQAHKTDRDWTKPIDDDPHTLYDLLEKAVGRYQDQLLFGYIPSPGMPRVHITYNEMFGSVQAAARSMQELGVKEGDRVAMILNNSVEWATIAYAASALGASYTSMYTHQHGSEWAYIIGDSTPSILFIADDEILVGLSEHLGDDAEAWPSSGVVVLGDDKPTADVPDGVNVGTWVDFLSSGRKAQETDPFEPASLDHGRLATLIYTSGTTGKPKGVMLSNWNILHNITSMQGRFDIHAGDRTASFLPWAHSFGQMGDLHFMVHQGVHINIISDLTKIVDECAEIRPHALFAVPRIWNRVYDKVMAGMTGIKGVLGHRALKLAKRRIERAGVELVAVPPRGFMDKLLDKIVLKKIRGKFGGEMRFCVSGGAALSPEVATFIQCVGFSIFEGFGLTETSPLVSLNGWEEGNHCRIGSVGRVVPGVRVIIDQDAWEDPDTEDGEVVIDGPNVMQGYWNKEEETNAVMTDEGYFRTGDLGRIDDGFLFITGRVKEQFKLQNGKYVAPAPLEESLKLSPYVEQCLVDGSGKTKTFTVIVPDFQILRTKLEQAKVAMPKTNKELANDKAVCSWVLEDLKSSIMSGWKGFEVSGSIIIDYDEWTTENRLLTPKLSVRRKQVLDRHDGTIEAI